MARPSKARAHAEAPAPDWVLRLYVTGMSPASARAITAIKSICEEHVPDHYSLRVFDVCRDPEPARLDDVRATPSLVRVEPLPELCLVGRLDDRERVIHSLGLPPRRSGHQP